MRRKSLQNKDETQMSRLQSRQRRTQGSVCLVFMENGVRFWAKVEIYVSLC